jgi:hypothetical protein
MMTMRNAAVNGAIASERLVIVMASLGLLARTADWILLTSWM